MTESPVEELARRALTLAKDVKPECQGNGCYNREYEIGKISLVIEGWWGASPEDWNKEHDTGYFVDHGEVELLGGNFSDPPIQLSSDNDLILKVLKEVREHMDSLETNG